MGQAKREPVKGSRSQGAGPSEGPLMVFMRAWLWFVPVAMLAAALVFAVLAAIDGKWALLVVMVVIGFFAIGLLVFHWWAMYRFGRSQGERSRIERE